MKRLVLSLCCVSFLAANCGESSTPENIEGSSGVVATPGESMYADPDTGNVYVLNPNRRVLSADGATGATQPRELPDGTTEVQSAINTSGTDTDWSGRVQIQVVECSSGGIFGTFVTGSISIGCSVSPDYVLVGGGAQDVWRDPGAMLWESRPQDVDNFGAGTTWMASSKDHLRAANHLLHVWAVGLKLKRTDGTFLNHDALKNHMSFSRV